MDDDRRTNDHLTEEPGFGERENGPDDVELSEDDYTMETASEIAAPGIGNKANLSEPEREEEEQDATMDSNVNDESLGKGLGVTALILSICALFFLPIVTGGAGIVLGIFAARKEAKALGYWSIGIGAFAIVMTVLFAPFF
ncbi:hypothetical protein J2S78_002138 [Salibacterium salarium]|uniref:DUF4190 domain-containing protein n=1 Tax=Salibacterium salarium TaxID=284579 RepID=UPI002787B5CB|nr:DUF4190 domain-containing protein [Salibacterium salarium]MDQ0299718.1 hypothetical protein [Salibacterium salarium]